MPVPSCVATIGLAQDSSTGQAGTAPCGRRHCGEGGVTRVPSSFGSSLLPRLCKQQTPHEKLVLCVLIPNCRSHHLRSVRWPFECPSNPHRKFPTTYRPVETFSFLPSSPEHLKLFPLSTSHPKGLLPKHPESHCNPVTRFSVLSLSTTPTMDSSHARAVFAEWQSLKANREKGEISRVDGQSLTIADVVAVSW